jgi:hypothetical protein
MMREDLIARQAELRARLQELAAQATQIENQINSQQQALQTIRAEGLKIAGALDEITRILTVFLPFGTLDGTKVLTPQPITNPPIKDPKSSE